MSKNSISFNIDISGGKFVYSDYDWRKQIEEFKSLNEQKAAKITIEVIDSPAHWQHKYYFGYLLPDIAHALGEKNIHFVHLLLKRDFLYIDCDGIDQVPGKYCKKGIYPIIEENLFKLNPDMNIPFSMIKGCVICYSTSGEVIGYIPSNANLTYEEKKAFHEKIEHRLFVDLAGRLGEEGRGQGAADRARDLSKGQE